MFEWVLRFPACNLIVSMRPDCIAQAQVHMCAHAIWSLVSKVSTPLAASKPKLVFPPPCLQLKITHWQKKYLCMCWQDFILTLFAWLMSVSFTCIAKLSQNCFCNKFRLSFFFYCCNNSHHLRFSNCAKRTRLGSDVVLVSFVHVSEHPSGRAGSRKHISLYRSNSNKMTIRKCACVCVCVLLSPEPPPPLKCQRAVQCALRRQRAHPQVKPQVKHTLPEKSDSWECMEPVRQSVDTLSES